MFVLYSKFRLTIAAAADRESSLDEEEKLKAEEESNKRLFIFLFQGTICFEYLEIIYYIYLFN